MEIDLRARAAHTAAVGGARRTPALLDVLWTAFTDDLYTVWVKVWIAAADDPELYAALAPLERPQSAVFAAIAADAAPKNVPRAEWTRRFSVALDAMRGLALTPPSSLGRLRFNEIPGRTSDASSPAFSTADRGESRNTTLVRIAECPRQHEKLGRQSRGGRTARQSRDEGSGE